MINYVSQYHFSYFRSQISTNMMLECATCSNVTVWTRVCMAPMTQFPHLAQSQGTTSHSIVAATARNRVNEYVTDIHSEVHGEGQCIAAAFWQQKITVTTNCHSTIPLIVQNISAPAPQAFVERLSSVCGLLTVGRRNRMDKSLKLRAWLK